ncbi:MAG: DUF2807 domain-containing protein [Betaproteobacteria bacterium]|nr:DUF2807 domain-containing protein [Betaproteobacteria bacterium]
MRMNERVMFPAWVIGTVLALTSVTALAEQMTRPAAGVTRIVFNTPGELVVRPGADEKVIADAEEASGSGKTVVARIEGAGNIDTTSYQAQTVEAKIEGSGTIRVHADESLSASISGAGNIEYKGKAKVTQSITGAGNVGRI